VASLWQDLKYGIRLLAKNPWFTAVAVLTLALGIGANTAIFSTVNALLLHPHPFPRLDQLVLIQESSDANPGDLRVAPADFVDFQRESDVFERIAASKYQPFNLTAVDQPEDVQGYLVSPNFLDVIGVRPALGRGFYPSEEEPGRDQVVLLSYGLWQRRFGGDPSVVGKTIQINGRTHTVIGVMSKDFDYPLGANIWAPMATESADKVERASPRYYVVGRLKSTASLGRARAELKAIATRLASQYPKTNQGRTVALLRLREEQYQYTAALFLMLQAAAAFVLLLACANVTSLLLARFIGRQREIAIRKALGASQSRFLQLFLTETLLLAFFAVIVAVAVSFWCADLIRTSIPQDISKWVAGWNQIHVDARVLIFTLLIAAVVAIFFGMGTALQTIRVDLIQNLKEGSMGAGGSRSRHRLLGLLVVAQIVLALVLLVGAGLMMKGMMREAGVYQRLEPAGVLSMEINLPNANYAEDAGAVTFFQTLLDEVKALPGVESVSVADNLPASGEGSRRSPFSIENRAALAANGMPSTDIISISSDYFRVLHIPIQHGRAFTEQDGRDAVRVAVASESLARRFWPNADPIGQRIKLGPPESKSPFVTIVGVAGDVKQNWWEPQSTAALYLPFPQAPARTAKLAVRTSSDPMASAPSVASLITRLDSAAATNEMEPLDVFMESSLSILRIIVDLMVAFGILALVLAAVGVYGVLSQAVAERTHEFGVRLALGAQPRAVLKQVIGQSLKLAGTGLLIALPLAVALNRVMASVLFGVVDLSWGILGEFMALLVSVALLAGYLPARRAMRVDPMVALRHE
jgi:putative ABC transport system permease protein